MDKFKVRCLSSFGLFILVYIVFNIFSCTGIEYSEDINIVTDNVIETGSGTISHSLEWVDTEHSENSYKGTIVMSEQDYFDSKNYKESYWWLDKHGNPDEYKLENSKNAFLHLKEAFVWNRDVSSYTFDDDRWNSPYLKTTGFKEGYSYMKSYYHDKSRLDYLYSVFNKIQKEKNLNRNEFADMIVSFVQNIDYSLPVSTSCEEACREYDWIKKHIDNGGSCDSYVPFGYYSPNEFMGNWTGDCDTRTVFLFTVLKHYSYDVIILNSDLYSHSILGINLTPLEISNPLYKFHNRKRYYTWETTSQWPLGLLPPDCSNMNYWNAALDNNLQSSVKYIN